MQIRESAENYLETILMIQKEKGSVRSIDVARHLDYSKPSVSRAMALLKGSGYVVIDPDGLIHLTDSGQEIAERIYERHDLFTRWLVMLGVDPEVAADDACKIEHDISAESFGKIKEHILEEHPDFRL
jgi:Mn-dependent DtxR family transcriptional regulator